MYRIPQLDGVEDVKKYRPGGFHPVNLQDTLGGKYKIIHKLGHGGFGTVWLGRVLEENRNVAIKVLMANASSNDLDILTYLRDHGGNHPSIANLQDVFILEGPNGHHQCLVLDIAGPSLKQLVADNISLAGRSARLATRKIAEGVAHLHSVGICHGDLTDSNVLFELENITSWSQAQVYQHLGTPITVPLLMQDGFTPTNSAPLQVVQSIQYSNVDLSLLTSNIRIIDFGESFSTNNPPAQMLGAPATFFAPEMLFGYSASTASDIWSLGCLIYELQASKALIYSYSGRHEEALDAVVQTFGPLPEHWRPSYFERSRKEHFQNGEKDPWFEEASILHPLQDLVDNITPRLSAQKAASFCDVLKGTLAYEPKDRLSAAEIANHPWFTTER